MLKKILKYTLRTLLVLLAVLLLVPALLYIPAVQNFIRSKAVGYASRTLGMELSVEHIRLAFPLRLTVDHTLLVDRADTLIRCKRLSIDAALWPLVRKEVVIRNFELAEFAAHYRDSAAGMDLKVTAELLSLSGGKADLSGNKVAISRIGLSDGDVFLDTWKTASAEKTDSAAAPAWAFDVERLTVGNTVFSMRTAPDTTVLSVRLTRGAVDTCRVRLENRQVDVASLMLDRGAYSYFTAPAATSREAAEARPAVLVGTSGSDTESREPNSNPVASGMDELPWTIRVGSVMLTDNQLEYGTLHHQPAAAFDPARIALSSLDLVVDSIYNRGADIALWVRRLAFAERCGLVVRNMSGRIVMDAHGVSLSGFDLETAASQLQADLSAGPGILHLEPDASLAASLSASLNTRDAALFYPALNTPVLYDRILRMDLSAAGSLGDIRELELRLSSPGHLRFDASGAARNLTDPARLAASARFEGDFVELDFLKALLPDSALRQRIAIPSRLGLSGSAHADNGTFSGTSTLTVADGRLSLDGRFDSRSETYEAALRCDSLPLDRFLPADSMGILDMTLTARGEGFDFGSAQTRSHLRAHIDRAEYRGRDFGGIGLEVALEDRQLSGRLLDSSELLRLDLSLSGTLTPQRQQLALAGRIFNFDPAGMGLVQEPAGTSFTLQADAEVSGGRNYNARIALDSIEIRHKYRTDRIRATNLAFATDTAATRAGLQSGDLSLSFAAPSSLDSLIAALTRSVDSLKEQIRSQRIDMERLKPVLPEFNLHISAGRDNLLNSYLKARKAAFRALSVDAVNRDSLPFSIGMRVEGLSSGKIRLDTVRADIGQQGRRLDYELRVANAPGNLDHVARAGVSGYVVENTGRADLYQRNQAGDDGFRFGWDVLWSDSLVRATMTPRNPLFGAEPWTVNTDNYLVYRFDGDFGADLDLTHGVQRIALHTLPEADSSDAVRLDIAGLRIGAILGMLPSAPSVDGVLGAGVTLDRSADSLSLGGDVSVTGLSYEKQRFGDVALDVSYQRGREQRGSVRLSLDGAEVLTARGDYDAARKSPIDLTATIPGFELSRANVFLPSDLLSLAGTLSGTIRAAGAPDSLDLNGGIRFAQTSVRVPMIGTSFRLSSDTIRITESRVLFDEYAITAPNRNPLTIDGEVDLADFSKIRADISLRASDFQAVNVARKERTEVYGTAYLDLDATARGPLDELVVRGNVALLGGTDISYVMQDSPMDIKERPQNVVTFVSFRDMDSQEIAQTLRPVRIGGMDVVLNVDINNDVKAAVDLSTDGQNRIDLQGGGNLTYTMNPLGDVRFSGKYVLSGGTVRYNPPVISQKIFKIRPDGYVEWLGNIADPSFNITAVETIQANVSADGQESRPVNFEISINIRNTLADLSVSFDLSAPEDLTMQNQLNSLTAEQRANQAMSLLIYNTYTGPGTTAKVSAENPLNAFIQKELNQWAQNNLKGVDLSFGIRSYGEDDPAGQRTDYSYRLSKNLFGNRVRAVIGGTFSTDADPSQNLKENLIDDISLEYMLTKRDNMFLKLFRHTGYESILEGEITETGVGFVIRKRLLKLSDLFRLTKRSIEKQQQDESASPSK